MSKPTRRTPNTPSKFGGALSKLRDVQNTTPVNPEPDSTLPDDGLPENLNSGKPETEDPTGEQAPTREKFSTYLSSELVTELKVHAALKRRKINQVVEEALREYLARQNLKR